LKFAKYLPFYGWQPIILTVRNGTYSAVDSSLSDEIPPECRTYNTKALQPFEIYQRFTGEREREALPTSILSNAEGSWKKRMARWIRLNVFVPDARIGWLPFAVNSGKKIISKEKPDIILSSSPPPTTHLIAKHLKKISKLPWIADFRDPWTDIYHYADAVKTDFTKKIDSNLERQILNSADAVLTVSDDISEMFTRKTSKHLNIHTITNGYDEEDFPPTEMHRKHHKFTLAYAGKFNQKQNPKMLWNVLSDLTESNKDFSSDLRLLFIGSRKDMDLSDLSKLNLKSYLETTGYLGHKAALGKLQEADVLLLLIPDTKNNKGIITGKLFEYIYLRKHIFVFGPHDGEAALIIRKLGMGQSFTYDEYTRLKKALIKHYGLWKEQSSPDYRSLDISEYSRKHLTGKLSSIMEMYA
jgi:hypothetical protein